MSKTHTSIDQSDIDAEIAQYLQSSNVKPVDGPKAGDNTVDLFGGSTLKKKSLLQRLLTYLFPNRHLA